MNSESLTDTLRETLAVFESTVEPLTTPEVAECLDLGRRSAYARLEQLAERDRLETKKVGASARVWWRPSSSAAFDADPDSSPSSADIAARDWPAAAESLVDVLADVEVGIFVLDESFDVAWINTAAERYFGLDRTQVLGSDKRHLVETRIVPVLEDAETFAEAVLATYDDNTDTERFECHVTAGNDREERWLERRSEPIESGAYAGGRVELYYDVTGQKGTRKRLERQRDELRAELDDVVDRIDDAVYGLDEGWRFTYVNDRAEDLLGAPEEELVGTVVWDVYPDALESTLREQYERAVERQESITFEEYFDTVDALLQVTAYPSESGLSVALRDTTGRKERERALEESEQRYRTLVENFPNGAVALLDDQLRHTVVGGQGFEKLDFDADDLQDEWVGDVYPEDILETVEPNYRAALDGERNSFELSLQGRTFEFRTLPLTTDDGDVFGLVAMSQDVTERKRYEERLQALYASSRRFLTAETRSTIGEILVETASDLLDLPGVVVYEYDARRDRLVPETASGEAGFVRAELPAVSPDGSSITGQTFSDGDSRYYEDVRESPALQVSPEASEMRSGLFVPLVTEGVLVAGSREVDGFDAATRQLVELLATNAEDTYKRVAREQELIRQREQLTALNSLNQVTREITDAVIDRSTREEIEQVVCDALAAADAYEFAWLAGIDPTTDTLEPRATSGTRGYADEISISLDPDDPASDGPAATAFREQEPQIVRDVFADPGFEPWREAAAEYGFDAVASIPIVHDGTVYGVLNLYTDRPNAFDAEEQRVMSQLGTVVGHAIVAAERKQTLMSDEVVELDFLVQDLSAALDLPVEMAGTITLDTMIPVGADEFLVYGTATPEAIDTVYSLAEVLDSWETVTVHTEGDPTGFELRLSDSRVVSVVASLGGYIAQAVIEDGDFRLTIHLAPNVDVHRVVDAVEEAYPRAEMLRRRLITRDNDDPQRIHRHLVRNLTDQQSAALEAAYHAGFFEWPRETSGEEVAESMGVAPPTFHQHLRKAERKAFDLLLESTVRGAG